MVRPVDYLVLFKDTGGGRTRTKDTVGHDTNHHVSDTRQPNSKSTVL